MGTDVAPRGTQVRPRRPHAVAQDCPCSLITYVGSALAASAVDEAASAIAAARPSFERE